MLGQINIQEPPLLPDLRARDQPGLGPGLQRVRVQAQEFGGGLEVEGLHGLLGN